MAIPLEISYYNSKISLGGNFMSIIEVKNISKRFNDKLVLDNISYLALLDLMERVSQL